MKIISLFLLSSILLLSGCEKYNTETIVCGFECDQKVVVSETQYKNAPNDYLHIYEVEIQGDCLYIKFGSSGCSGDTWNVKLVASEMEYLSIPPQRDVRLSLENNELCEAYFTREMSFDISDLKPKENEIIINIIDADTSVLYH